MFPVSVYGTDLMLLCKACFGLALVTNEQG